MIRRTTIVAALAIGCTIAIVAAIVGMSDRGEATSFAVLGDSYAVGYGATKGNGWVEQLAAQMCWSLTNRSAEGGTGYTTPGEKSGYAVFGQRVSAVTDGRPGVVLVEGGTNDDRASSEEITTKATAVFNAIKAQVADETAVIAVGPILTPKKNADNLVRVSAAIAQAAAGAGVRYIDPVLERWVDDVSLFFDAYHPNDAGYTEYTRRLALDLKQAGVEANC